MKRSLLMKACFIVPRGTKRGDWVLCRRILFLSLERAAEWHNWYKFKTFADNEVQTATATCCPHIMQHAQHSKIELPLNAWITYLLFIPFPGKLKGAKR
jgi:hypothetical protein